MERRSSGIDMNGKIAALLRDFAAIQKSKQSMWGYKRAASAILALEEPIESFLHNHLTDSDVFWVVELEMNRILQRCIARSFDPRTEREKAILRGINKTRPIPDFLSRTD